MKDFPNEHILLHFAREMGFKKIVEIGVFSGTLTSRVVGAMVREESPLQKYYCIDPWAVYIDYYHRDHLAKEADPEWWELIYQKALHVQSLYPKIVVIERMKSVDASAIYRKKNLKVDAVYIDAIHDEQHVIQDIYGWLPMIKKGGFIGGHDYIKSYTPMALAVSAVFKDRLNIMVVDDSRPPLSYKNTAQGGNWWVWVNNKLRNSWMKTIEDIFPQHIEAMK